MSSAASRVGLMIAVFATALGLVFGTIVLLTDRVSAPEPSAVGGPFTLVDQDGGTISDKMLRGRPFLMFFGFTHCPDICPTALSEVSDVMEALGPDAKRTAALFVSVDPERDTPAVLKDYLSSFDPNLRAATADPATIAAVAKAFRVYYKKIPLEHPGDYTMDHTAIVYLMDKNGRFVAPFNLKRPPQDAAAELRRYF